MAEKTAKAMRGTRVASGSRKKKVGKVTNPVLHPSEARVVGYVVKRPDLLWMFKRKDRFVALDALRCWEKGLYSVDERGAAWDDAALKRMGLDYNQCRLLLGQQVRCADGSEMGYIHDLSFEETTGQIKSVSFSTGGVTGSVLGDRSAPASMLVGYGADGALIISNEAASLEFKGGAAEKMGEAAGKAKQGAKAAGAKAVAGAKRLGEKAPGVMEDASNKAKSGAKTFSEKAPEMAKSATKVVTNRAQETKGALAAFKEEYEKGLQGKE